MAAPKLKSSRVLASVGPAHAAWSAPLVREYDTDLARRGDFLTIKA